MANDINFNLAHAEKYVVLADNPFTDAAFNFLRQHSAFAHYLFLRFMVLNDKYNVIAKLNLNAIKAVPVELKLIDKNGMNMISYMEGEAATYFKNYSPLTEKAFGHLEKVLYQFNIFSLEKIFN